MKYWLPLALLALALPLSAGIGQSAPAASESPAPGDAAAVAMHDHGCTGDDCRIDPCPPQTGDSGGCVACQCACGHLLWHVARVTERLADVIDIIQSAAAGGSAPRRPDHPFRPPI